MSWMSLMAPLATVSRLLMEADLRPIQTRRFQPTGFPDLGAATYTLPDGTEMLLVESSQSMANRLEAVCWDDARGDLIAGLDGLPYVRARLPAGQTTSSILEAHRLNSPYLIDTKDKGLANRLQSEFGEVGFGPVDQRLVARTVFKYDPNAVLHGVFFAGLPGGRLRMKRCLSAFIEAEDVRPVESGGVKNDRVNPGGSTREGYGNVPFPRTEYVARRITAYFNLDLATLRGYGMGEAAEELLVTLALFKVRRFLETGLRLRTACDLTCEGLRVSQPEDFDVPDTQELGGRLRELIGQCRSMFASPPVTEVTWEPKPKPAGKDGKGRAGEGEEPEAEDAGEPAEEEGDVR